MIIIGEKINGSIPSVAEAIAKRDAAFIKERARMQAQANATFHRLLCVGGREGGGGDTGMDDRLYPGGDGSAHLCGQSQRRGVGTSL